jgi:riboflavin kinase/FMN adenylyltransferase
VRYKEFVVSSTRIRRLISEGRVDEAGALLGHPYGIDGTVVTGDGRGRTLGFPTANLATDNELLPPNGVYATTVRLDGVIYPSVTNIGVRPTFGDEGRTVVETHLLGVEMDLYGRSIGVGFVQRVRDERRFDSVDQLTAQIASDVLNCFFCIIPLSPPNRELAKLFPSDSMYRRFCVWVTESTSRGLVL